jgi:hypothetical protein
MRILVFGGRDYDDRNFLEAALDFLHSRRGITCIIHGKCHLGGADLFAEEWAKMMCIPDEAYPVDLKRDGPWPGAGPIRNARMLADSNPDGAVQFPGGSGTMSMRRLCDNRKPIPLKVWEPAKETINGRTYEPARYPVAEPVERRGL